MNLALRHTAVTLALALAATLGPTAATDRSSYAAAEATTTPPPYHRVTWLTEYGSFSIDAPSGWRVTRPAEHTGRATSADGSLRLSLTELRGTTTVTKALAGRVTAIERLDDADLLGTRSRTTTPATGGYAGIELSLGSVAYRWRDTPVTSRLVLTRYLGLDLQQGVGPRAIYEITVSGPADTASILRTMLRRVTPSVFSTP